MKLTLSLIIMLCKGDVRRYSWQSRWFV